MHMYVKVGVLFGRQWYVAVVPKLDNVRYTLFIVAVFVDSDYWYCTPTAICKFDISALLIYSHSYGLQSSRSMLGL